MAENTKPYPDTPTLQDFEHSLLEISKEVSAAVSALYNEAKEDGKVHPNGYMIDACAIGSTVMYLDRRRALYKFFAKLDKTPSDFYLVSVYDNQIRMSLRIDNVGQSYTLRYAANEILANRLREIYGWEIYNDVRVD
jgi:hypothetical protein